MEYKGEARELKRLNKLLDDIARRNDGKRPRINYDFVAKLFGRKHHDTGRKIKKYYEEWIS